MGCCNASTQVQNPDLLSEISSNLQNIKGLTFEKESSGLIPYKNLILDKKKTLPYSSKDPNDENPVTIQKSPTIKDPSNKDPAPFKNTSLKESSIKELPNKDFSIKVLSIKNLLNILKKDSEHSSFKSKEVLNLKDQKDYNSCGNDISLKDMSVNLVNETTTKNGFQDSILSSTIAVGKLKPRRSISQISVGPEIFIQLKKQNLLEKYSIGQFLGKGAFGQVKLVTHKATGLVRAMKIIKKNSLLHENENKFFAELVILKNLDHPNIVRLLDLFQDEENYNLITEYCSGGELFDRVRKIKYMSELQASNIMKQILMAVVYCHSQNIVHRDLKPENIVFESIKPDSVLKIIDFGTSRKFAPNKKMTKTLGTAYYIAPEVLNQNYNEKCDIWSCGVILYILLCGYPPFSGKSQEEIFYRIKLGRFEFKEKDWSTVSEEAKGLIKQMLRYDPSKRISAEEALNHKWVNRNSNTEIINSNAMQNLLIFHATNQIQAAIYAFIVNHLTPPQEKEELRKCFENLDKNGDGKLSPDELIDVYLNIYGNKEEARYLVAKIIKEADKNFSGKIDYTEFLVASTKRERLLSKNKVDQTFKLFDIDGNGFITKEELKQLMGDSTINDQVWGEILEEFDTNKDGKISQQEFIDMLYHKYQN